MNVKSNIDNLTDSQKDLLLNEIGIINQKIKKFDDYSYVIKGWTITLWSGITSLFLINIISNSLSEYTLYIPGVITFFFWGLDGISKKYQRFSIARNEEIEDFLNNKLPEDYEFYIYDAVARLSRDNKDFEAKYIPKTKFWKCFLVRSVSSLYQVLITVTFFLGIFFIPNYIIVNLILGIFFLLFFSLCWYFSHKRKF